MNIKVNYQFKKETKCENSHYLQLFHSRIEFQAQAKLYIPSTYYKNLKKGAQQSHMGRQKMDWFLADQPVHQVKLKYQTKQESRF